MSVPQPRMAPGPTHLQQLVEPPLDLGIIQLPLRLNPHRGDVAAVGVLSALLQGCMEQGSDWEGRGQREGKRAGLVQGLPAQRCPALPSAAAITRHMPACNPTP
jgi:hypothetical protein